MITKSRDALVGRLWLVIFGTLMCCQTCSVTFAQSGPRLIIEHFGCSKPYVVAGESITLVGTVKNVGNEIVSKTYLGRMSCLTGLEYGDGDTLPKITGLQPGESKTFKWRVNGSSSGGPQVASFVIEAQDESPQVQVITVPRLNDEFLDNVLNVSRGVACKSSGNIHTIQNERLKLSVMAMETGMPFIQLSKRESLGWNRVAVSTQILEVLSAEGLQVPWWEYFRADQVSVNCETTKTTLAMDGVLGLRWKASVEFSISSGSSSINCRTTLSPRKPMKLSGVSFGNLKLFDPDQNVGEFAGTTAIDSTDNSFDVRKTNLAQIGMSWDFPAEVGSGKYTLRSKPIGASYVGIGSEWNSNSSVQLLPGVVLTMSSRVFILPKDADASVAQKFKYNHTQKP